MEKKIIYNGIMGLCLADAVGVPYEFRSRETMLIDPATDMIGNGTHHVPIGTWSDDSSMVLATCDSLAKKYPVLDYEDIMFRFYQWMMNGAYTTDGKVFDVGISCRKAIQRSLHMDALSCGCTGERENGNGSLMRILPMAYYLHARYPDFTPNNENMDPITKVSALTHAHPCSIVGCGIYVCIAIHLLEGDGLTEAITAGIREAFAYYRQNLIYAKELSRYDRLKSPAALAQLSSDEIYGKGYIVSTLECALWSLLNTNDYKSAILKCINQGEDTDTTAAVAGGLAGLVYPLPSDWISNMKNPQMIEDICGRFADALIGNMK